MDVKLLDALIERVGDWRTWLALWFGILSFYLWKHSTDFVEILKSRLDNDCERKLAEMKQDVDECKDKHAEYEDARLQDARKIGALEAQVTELQRRTAGLSSAFVLARHTLHQSEGETHVPPFAD